MDRRAKRNRITVSDLDAAWAALDEANREPEAPVGVNALTLQELKLRWNIKEDSVASRKARNEYKDGRLERAKIVRGGRRVFVYWPKQGNA